MKKNTIAAFENYIETNPSSQYLSQAKTNIAKIKSANKAAEEKEAADKKAADEQEAVKTKVQKQDKENKTKDNSTDEKRKPIIIEAVEKDMILVKGGDFTIGCITSDKDCYDDEKNLKKISVPSFYMGQHEVTQRIFRKVMGYNKSRHKACNECPVENVSWKEAQAFVDKLNEEYPKHNYALPLESQWEYAAKAHQTVNYAGSSKISNVAVCRKNSKGTQPVGSKKGNSFGLKDMSGNVAEWCSNWYNKNEFDATDGKTKVARGGGFNSYEDDCRVTNRIDRNSDERFSDIGFRIVRNMN